MFDLRRHTMERRVDLRTAGAPITPGDVRDLHWMMLRPGGREVFMIGRRSDSLVIVDQRTGELKRTLTLSTDAPDLMDFSPDGRWAFSTLRGPAPRSGGGAQTWNLHAVPPGFPGLAVIDARSGTVAHVVTFPGDPTRQDPHGMAVRVLDRDERGKDRKDWRNRDFRDRWPVGREHHH
jgi:hypothetical protein